LKEYDTLKDYEEQYKNSYKDLKNDIMDMTKSYEFEQTDQVEHLTMKLNNVNELLTSQKSEFEIKYENLQYQYDNFKKDHEHTVNRKN